MGQRIEEKVSVVNEFTFDFDESLDEIIIPSFMNCLSLSMRFILACEKVGVGCVFLMFPQGGI